MIKAIIFDLNGIFIQSPKLSERFEKDFNVPIAEFIPVLSVVMDKVRQPNAGASFQYWKPELERWNITMSEQEFWEYWFKAETVSETMIAFAKELRALGTKVYVLSNNFKERAEYYGHYPWITGAIDKVYFSWQTGFVKPDPQAWLMILNENNLKPEECLYFDDQVKNLKAAEGVGIKAFLFSNEKDLEEKVRGHISN
jgi:HAD superfamily hydrolase (TIGR01509 family)